MNNNVTKDDMDKEIMNIFEEQEDKFSFPITSQKDARDFVKLLNKHGCSYEIISKEVDEDVERFRDWRLGGGSLEIGKHVLDRINRPFRDTMFSESENDDKDRRNSLNDFYQFSFDEEEVLTTLNSKTPKIEISAPTKATYSSNLPIDKSKNNLSPNRSSQTNISSAPKEIVTSQHQSSNALSTATKVDVSKCSAKVSQPANATVEPLEIKKCVELPSLSDKQKITATSPTASSHEKQSPQSLKPNQPDSSKNLSNTQDPLEKSSISATPQNEIKLPPSKRSTSPSLPTPQPANQKQSSSHSQSPQILTPSQSIAPQTISSPKSSTSQHISPKQSTTTNKEASESTEEERPPSPITTSPYYQPYAASFTVDDIEPMLNYNSDDQSDKGNKFDVAGFIYVFSDIPSPTMKVSKHTKFRVKVGTSKDPLKRLQQALHFNPDVRMLASIPIRSRNSYKSMLKESLKPMLMKNRVDWYWATLNNVFAAIDGVLKKCRSE